MLFRSLLLVNLSLAGQGQPKARACLTLSSTLLPPGNNALVTVSCLPFLTSCSDDSKPYMILKAFDESYKNHIGFATIRASDEEQQPPMSSHVRRCACVEFCAWKG